MVLRLSPGLRRTICIFCQAALSTRALTSTTSLAASSWATAVGLRLANGLAPALFQRDLAGRSLQHQCTPHQLQASPGRGAPSTREPPRGCARCFFAQLVTCWSETSSKAAVAASRFWTHLRGSQRVGAVCLPTTARPMVRLTQRLRACISDSVRVPWQVARVLICQPKSCF